MRYWALLLLVACSSKDAPPPRKREASPRGVDPWAASTGSAAVPHPKVTREAMLAVTSDLMVLKHSDDFTNYDEVVGVAEQIPGVIAAEPFLLGDVRITRDGWPRRIHIKGTDPKRVTEATTLGSHMVTGSLADLARSTPPGIVIGDGIAKDLKVKVGDEVRVMGPADDHPHVFRVAGTFHLGFDRYDERLAIASLSSVESLVDDEEGVFGVEVRIRNADNSFAIAKTISDSLGGDPYKVLDTFEALEDPFKAALEAP